MEQIAQLKAMRDAAKNRLMTSPDWKLMVALDALIPDLEKAFGVTAASDDKPAEESGEPTDEEPASRGAAAPIETAAAPILAAAIAPVVAPGMETMAAPLHETPVQTEEPAAPHPAQTEPVAASPEPAAQEPEAPEPEVLAAPEPETPAPAAEPVAEPSTDDFLAEFESSLESEFDLAGDLETELETVIEASISVVGEQALNGDSEAAGAVVPPVIAEAKDPLTGPFESEEDAVNRALDELSLDLASITKEDDERNSIFSYRP